MTGSAGWLTSGSVELVVEADAHSVYDVVSDVTRIGERSPECRSAEWVEGTPGAVGAVFRGHNRWGWAARWSRRCEETAAEPGRVFAFRTVPERFDPSRHDSTTWTYRLQPVEGGTRVEHSYDITMMPGQPFLAVYGLVLPHHRDMRPQMWENPEALRRQLAGTASMP